MNQPIEIQSTQRSDVLSIRWNPNNVCNYSCHYCFDGSNAGTHKSPTDLDLTIKNFDCLISYYKKHLNKKKVILTISGGEPTLWKDLHTFIRKIKELHDVYVIMITNGSRTLRWWEENGKLFDDVVISYHVAEANIDHCIGVADILYAFNISVTVNVMMDHAHWSRAVISVDRMLSSSKHKWSIQVSEIITDKYHYTEEQKDYLKVNRKRIPPWWHSLRFIKTILLKSFYESRAFFDSGKIVKAESQYYINNNWNHFSGWRCSIGLESIYIHWDGTIIGACWQKLYNLNYSFNILDSNFTEIFSPTLEPITCKALSCVCQPETHVSKINFSEGNVRSTCTPIPITLHRYGG